jgi:hypothetical protein
VKGISGRTPALERVLLATLCLLLLAGPVKRWRILVSGRVMEDVIPLIAEVLSLLFLTTPSLHAGIPCLTDLGAAFLAPMDMTSALSVTLRMKEVRAPSSLRGVSSLSVALMVNGTVALNVPQSSVRLLSPGSPMQKAAALPTLVSRIPVKWLVRRDTSWLTVLPHLLVVPMVRGSVLSNVFLSIVVVS